MRPIDVTRSAARPGFGRPRLILAAVATIVIGGAVAGLWSHRDARRVRSIDTETSAGYVGDQACARCHSDVAAHYRGHPMGRSLAPARDTSIPENASQGERVLFKAGGFEYSVAEREGGVFHQETRRDVSGRLVARVEGRVGYVLGSGRRGLSFLIERDGFLTQSPISWYTQRAKWDLSPGYERRNAHFDRPVGESCLYCHANHANLTPGSVNHYETPIFQGHAIGCERCHGPGEEHSSRPSRVDGRDDTIVNPARLEPSLRDAVCEQCHLSGARRIPRLGRRDQDFRPGQPFQRFWTVLVPAEGAGGDRFVGQVEQMRESRCHAASQGRLGCVSCHDPHQSPEPGERQAFYRDRCLNCHADKPCSLANEVRLKQGPADDCVSCHMPRQRIVDVVHAATTDHRVPRFASGKPTVEPRATSPLLVPFHAFLMNDQERAGIDRDLGIAICRDGIEGAARAISKLEPALKTNHHDPAGWEAHAIALGELGRKGESLAAWREAVAQAPMSETATSGMAAAAQAVGDRELAVASWRKAVAIAPLRSEYRAGLASALFETRDWSGAATESRRALELNPADLETRQLLTRCLLRLGDQAAAREQFGVLLDFDPPDRADLLRRFPTLAPIR